MINRKEKTILLLRDNYPGYNMSESIFIENAFTEHGYFVKAITTDELSGNDVGNVHINKGFMLVVPSCRTLPIDVAPMLKRFMESAGGVLFTGGPLFYDLIKKGTDDTYIKTPFNDTLDGNMASGTVLVREGIAPYYKTFTAKNIKTITNVSDGIFGGELSFAEGTHNHTVSVPCETGTDSVFNPDGLCRFIPLATCSDVKDPSCADIFTLGRKNGNRGLFSFIELEKTYGCGYLGKVNYGSVESTAVGSAVASIGCHCSLESINGASALLCSIADSFRTGLYLMNGGTDGIRYRKGEHIIAGAEIFNMTDTFKKVTLRISVETLAGTKVLQKDKLMSPHNVFTLSFGDVTDALTHDGIVFDKECEITTELVFEGRIVDRITSFYSFENPKACHDSTAYITTDGDKFKLGNKHWYLAGINYWNTYNTALEISDYWKGMFDKSNYNPRNTEHDLDYISKLGLNCLLTRIDFTDIENVKHGVRDFLARCKKHNLRVMIAITEATKSKYYNRAAVEEIFSQMHLANNPTVIAFDIEWESVNDHFSPAISGEFNDEWQAWLEDKYGSVENAENAHGVKYEHDMYGYVLCRNDNLRCFTDYKRFAEECIDKYWDDLTRHLGPLVPHQMLTFRYGGCIPRTKAQATKYIDFSPLETYGILGIEKLPPTKERHTMFTGAIVSCALIEKHESGGKPIVWAEYGKSLCGVKWIKDSFAYDHDNMKYLDECVEEQRIYNSYFINAIESYGAAGSAPWWWCGGFRYSELADFGYLDPSGLLCESGKDYVLFCERMKRKTENDAPLPVCNLKPISVKGNPDDYLHGKETFLKEVCLPAYTKASETGKRLEIVTEYNQ